VKKDLPNEGYDEVLQQTAARVVPDVFVASAAAQTRQSETPVGLRFGLQLSSYPGGRTGLAAWVREAAERAEAAGFDAIYVMDHFRQIPQVGRAWDDFLESWTTLGYLVQRLRPRNVNPARYAAAVNAGTVDDQIGRFRELSEAGVTEVMISLPDLETLDAAADVISAFRT
jgi:hypothetical protein